MIKRYHFIDALRGITVALMIIVNSPGTNSPFKFLEHATWDGCTLADVVFPFFIILVGLSATLSLANDKAKGTPSNVTLKKISQRTLKIFALGLCLNALPNHFNFETIRYFGVLQRIAVCYLFSACFYLTLKKEGQLLLFLSLLLIYEALLALYSPLHLQSVNHNLVGTIDSFFFNEKHLYLKTFDPEGMLSTIGAICSALLGNLLALSLIAKPKAKAYLTKLLGIATVLLALGAAWHQSFAINKSLWSSAYVLWSGGLFLLFYLLGFYVMEVKRIEKVLKPFIFLGQHALFIYCLHVILLKAQAFIKISYHKNSIINLRLYLGEYLFGGFSASITALLYSISFLIICSMLTYGYAILHNYLKVCQNPQKI